VQVVALLVFARLLTPADFGTFALLTPFIAVASIAREAGFASSVVRRPSINDAELSTIFWANLATGACVAGLFLLLAGPYARFFAEPLLASLIQATAAMLMVGTLSSQHMALALRNLQFGAFAMIESGSLVVGLAAGITYAALTASVWALWVFPCVTAAVSTFAWWSVTPWRPGRLAPRAEVMDIVRDAGKIATASLLDLGARTVDKILIGRLFGPEPLGFYDRAYKLVLLPLMFVTAPLERFLLPYLSRAVDDRIAYRLLYGRAAQTVMLLAAPPITLAIANAESVVALLFGPGWEAAAPLFAWLGVASLAQLAIQTLNCVLISRGRSGALAIVTASGAFTAVAAVAIGFAWNLVAVAAIYAALELCRVPLVFWWTSRMVSIEGRYFGQVFAPFLASVSLGLVVDAVISAQFAGSRIVVLVAAVLVNGLLAILCLALTQPGRDLLSLGWGILRNYMARR
jgi:PST family polysaccharide transporter